MGIVHSVFRCLCFCLDDDDVEGQRLADHRDINPYAGVPAQAQQSQSFTTYVYRPLSFDPPTACSADTEPLISTRQPAVAQLSRSSSRSTDTTPLRQPAAAQLAPSSSQSTACSSTIRAGDPGPRPVSSSALNTTPPTPVHSTPRLQQQQQEAAGGSRRPSSVAVRTDHPVKREVTDDDQEARWRARGVTREVNGALQEKGRAVISSTPSRTSSTPSQSPAEPAILTPRHSQSLAAVGSISLVSGAKQKASAVAESGEAQTLRRSPSQQNRQRHAWVQKGAMSSQVHGRLRENAGNSSPRAPIPVYDIPPHLKEIIRLDKVPSILKEGLSPSNYREFFACLLYTEDFYLEKWSDFILKDINLECEKRLSTDTISINGTKYAKKLKDFVAFEIESIPERRPYILSRDYVILEPLGTNHQKIQGRVVKVRKWTKVLAEFEDDFWAQHNSEMRYDVSFSFNRVCLKRAHHAVANALEDLFGFLFPEEVHRTVDTLTPWSPYGTKLGIKQVCAINQIRNLKGFPPYLISGTPCFRKDNCLTETGLTIREAIIQIYRADSRILICSPKNIICDRLMTVLSKEIPESQQFRANAAFREYEDVPNHILPSCKFSDEGGCFTCPPLHELQAFKVVTSTYMSSFRLKQAGIKPGHFTHIFLIEASAVAEPEAVVPLANLASEDTAVVISGWGWGSPWYVRSDMARRWGLQTSYFERLLLCDLYKNGPSFICQLNEDSRVGAFSYL